jgi:hypothetical protein
MNIRNTSVAPTAGGAVVEFPSGSVFIPVVLEDGMPNATPGDDYEAKVSDHGITDRESAQILWNVESAGGDDVEWLLSLPVSGARRYQIAFAKADGSWDVVETFAADDDQIANEYAETSYSDQDWYVLDVAGQNINAR